MKTLSFRKQDQPLKWVLVDAEDAILGRLASQVATVLRGKNKPTYTPHEDLGDHVVIINSDKVKLTGAKLDNKIYYHHTGFPGGIKDVTARQAMEKDSTWVITQAVTGMLPKTKLGNQMAKKLRVYPGTEHPHLAQNPEVMTLSN